MDTGGGRKRKRVAPRGYPREGAGKFFPLGCKQKGNYFNCGQPRSTNPQPLSASRALSSPRVCDSQPSPSPSLSLLLVPHGKFHPLPVLKFSTTHAPIYVRASAYARLPRWQDLPVSKRGEGSILSRLCPFHLPSIARSNGLKKAETHLSFSLQHVDGDETSDRAIYIRLRTMPRILLNSTFHAFPLRGVYIYIYSVAIRRRNESRIRYPLRSQITHLPLP